MQFVKGVLADRRDLGSMAKLLHEQRFDRIEVSMPKLEYEPRWSDKCATCAALWIASKAGNVMRIELRVAATDGAIPTRAECRVISGERAARSIYHVHDNMALGGGSFLLIGRDNGMLDFVEDSSHSEPEPRSSFHLDSWSKDGSNRWIGVRDGFPRLDNPHAKYQNYGKGVTAIAAIAHPKETGILIVVATRHPRLHVIEARDGRLHLLKPKPLPGWIDWIICPSPTFSGLPADRRVTLISHGGDIVRLHPADIEYGPYKNNPLSPKSITISVS